MNETKDTLLTYYQLLPEQAQQKVSSPAWERDVASIGLKYGLSDADVTKLKDEVVLVLLAIEDPDLLVKNVQSELKLSSEICLEVVKDIDSMILYDVKDILEQTRQSNEAGIAEELSKKSQEQKPAIHDEIFIPATASKPEVVQNAVPENLPSLPEEHELTLPKIITPNSILNKQLEVPVAHPYEKPRPVEVNRVVPVSPIIQPPVKAPVVQPEIKKPAPSIVEARLSGSLTMHQEEITIPTDIPKQAPPAAPAAKVDPYREPIE